MKINILTESIIRNILIILGLFFIIFFVVCQFTNIKLIHFNDSNIIVDEKESNFYIDGSIKEVLKANYNNSSEYSMCLNGTAKAYVINGVAVTSVFINNYNNYSIGGSNYVLNNVDCDSLATIHSHPSGKCQSYLNIIDSYDAKDFYDKGGIYYIIQCGKNNLEIHKNNKNQAFILEI